MAVQRNFSKYSERPSKKVSIKYFAMALLLILGGILIYFYFFKSELTIVSGFNLTDERIKVIIDEKESIIEPGAMYTANVQRRGEFILTLKDDKNNVLRENRYLIGLKKTLIIELVSDASNQCLVEADVTSIYYESSEDQSVSEYKIINDSKPTNSFFYETEHDNKYLVYPGRYDRNLLPEIVPKNQKVIGLFFVDCENLNSQEDLNADILGSIMYEAN